MINAGIASLVAFLTFMAGGTLGMWAIWPTAEKHGWRRGYTDGHKRADREQPALPRAGRLEPVPDLEPLPAPVHHLARAAAHTPWVFVGGWDQGPVAVPAEKTLLTQTATLPAVDPVTGEQPIDTGEIMAITDRVEAWIAKWDAQGNYDRHTIQAGDR